MILSFVSASVVMRVILLGLLPITGYCQVNTTNSNAKNQTNVIRHEPSAGHTLVRTSSHQTNRSRNEPSQPERPSVYLMECPMSDCWHDASTKQITIPSGIGQKTNKTLPVNGTSTSLRVHPSFMTFLNTTNALVFNPNGTIRLGQYYSVGNKTCYQTTLSRPTPNLRSSTLTLPLPSYVNITVSDMFTGQSSEQLTYEAVQYPEWMHFDEKEGRLRGYPSDQINYLVLVRAKNSIGAFSDMLHVVLLARPVFSSILVDQKLPTGTMFDLIIRREVVKPWDARMTVEVQPSWPPWLQIDPIGYRLWGIPDIAEDYTMSVKWENIIVESMTYTFRLQTLEPAEIVKTIGESKNETTAHSERKKIALATGGCIIAIAALAVLTTLIFRRKKQWKSKHYPRPDWQTRTPCPQIAMTTPNAASITVSVPRPSQAKAHYVTQNRHSLSKFCEPNMTHIPTLPRMPTNLYAQVGVPFHAVFPVGQIFPKSLHRSVHALSAKGTDLPGWLKFNDETWTFFGIPYWFDRGRWDLRLVAEKDGERAEVNLSIHVTGESADDTIQLNRMSNIDLI